MKIPAGKRYSVEVRRIRGGGHPYIVSVYRKRFLWKCPVVSDWFLNEEQAKAFAEAAAADITESQNTNSIRRRQPGWHFKRPPTRFQAE